MSPTAAQLRAHGLRLTNARRYPAARRILERAAALSDDADLSALIAGTLGYVLGQLGEAAAGERIVRTALAAEGVSASVSGVVAGQLGSLLAAQGRRPEALHWLGRAIEQIEGDRIATANLRMNRSVLNMQVPDIPAVTADLEQAVTAYTDAGDEIGAAEARHNLGYTALLAGDLVRASREMTRARPVIAAASPANAAICDVDLAQVLREAGATADADRLLEQAASVFGAHRMPTARADAELQLARSLLRTDPVRARRVARAAARRFAAHGSGTDAARAQAVALRAEMTGGGLDRDGDVTPESSRTPDAAEVARVAGILGRAGLRSDAVALRLELHGWRARHGLPATRLPQVPPQAPVGVRVLAAQVHAWRAVAAGRDGRARRAAAAGLDELTAWRAAFGSLDLQASLAIHGTALLLTGIGAAVRSGDPALVFEWSERTRRIAQAVTPVRPAPDPELAADLTELRILHADLPAGQWLDDPRAVELAGRLRQRQWEDAGAAGPDRRLGLDQVRAVLGADTALISFVYGPAGLCCVVADSGTARIVPLTQVERLRQLLPGLRADLDVSAGVRAGPMATVVQRSLRTRLQQLSEVLIDPVLAACDAPRLVLTVPGILSGIPWSMLPGLSGRAVTLAGSASSWASGRGTARAATSAGFVAGPRVARASEEVDRAAAVWEKGSGRVTVLAREAATVAATCALASSVDVLHISAHGRHAPENPLLSGLELSDGALFGYDLDRMPRLPDTVILSACEVGRSAVRWGEEALGMTRAWLHAGSRCVIAAPVMVADDDACELLADVHTGLAAGLPPADALAAAAASNGIVAPFQCHGDGL